MPSFSPRFCRPLEDENDAEDGGCYLWYFTLTQHNRAPTHKECTDERCLWVDQFCLQCRQWEKGCAPAGKCKITPRNLFVLKHFNRHQGTDIDMFGLPSSELPRWIALRLDTLVAETEKQKLAREARLFNKEDR